MVPCLLVGAVVLSLDSGTTLDENVHRQYGEAILRWFASGFSDASATTSEQRVYGGLFDFAGALLSSLGVVPLGPFELLHVMTALLGVVGIITTWKLAALVGGPRAGFLAASYLTLTPAWVGHSFFNPKDIPFAVGATLALYASARICMARDPLSWRNIVQAGVSAGLALAVRPGGLFVLGYPVVAAIARAAADYVASGRQRRQRRQTKRDATSPRDVAIVATKLLTAASIAWLLMVCAWPWAQQAPLSRPFEAAAIAANYQWRHLVLFRGERIWSYELPWSYLPTWFCITLPEVYLIALGCSLLTGCHAARHRVWLWSTRRHIRATLCVLLCLGSIVAPLLAVIVTRPIVYDAQRHFLFLLPPLAAIAGATTSAWLRIPQKLPWLRVAMCAAQVVLAGTSALDMHSLHPYEYIYFNRVFGGLRAAQGRFETDYWSAANREAFTWAVDNIKSPSGHIIGVETCHVDWQVAYYKSMLGERADGFEVTEKAVAEVFLATTRNECHETKPGKIVHAVTRQGVPLAYVFER